MRRTSSKLAIVILGLVMASVMAVAAPQSITAYWFEWAPATMLEELTDPDPELVSRALTVRRQAPALDERVPIEHAQDDVRVADVDGEEHLGTPESTRSVIHSPRSLGRRAA